MTMEIVITGDFNQLKDSDLRLLGLFKEETEATRAGHHLDRVYTSEPMYRNISVIVPTVKTDHKAIYASAIDYDTHRPPKNKAKLKCRLHRPAQHAAYLAAFSKTRQEEDTNSDFVFDVDGGATPPSLQESFDRFYLQMQRLLDRFYPIRNITVTDRDPPYITPEIKLLLRKKNGLMRKGKIEAADAISLKIRKGIIARNCSTLTGSGTIRGPKDLWE